MKKSILLGFLVAFLLQVTFSLASVNSDVNVNVSIKPTLVLQVNNFTISPSDVPIGNEANFSIEVINIGNANGTARSLIQIYNGYYVIDEFESEQFFIPYSQQNVPINISVTHEMNYPVGSYLALGYVMYNNKTIGPLYKNFTINRGQPPFVYLVSPLNHSWTNLDNNSLAFVFYVDDIDSNTFTCRLYLDGQIVGEKTTNKGVNTTIYSNRSFIEGTQYWRVECIDNGNNSAFSQIWEINFGSFCSTLDVNNMSYTLYHDLYSNESCFRITGDNVTLDCNGYSIFFNSSSAIIAEGKNITIKNCILSQNNTQSSIGIEIKPSATGIRVINNYIDLRGNSSIGLKLSTGNATLFNNSFSIHGDRGVILYLENSTSNNIVNNTFTLFSNRSTFVFLDLMSNRISIDENVFISKSEEEGFSIQIYLNKSGLNLTLPNVRKTPKMRIYIPENAVEDITQLNISTYFVDSTKVPINIASQEGYLKMKIELNSSNRIETNISNPIIFTINSSHFNMTQAEESRLGLYLYNDSSQVWESIATSCNLSSRVCEGYLTHLSTYGWIVRESEMVVSEVEKTTPGINFIPLSGKLSCTKELAQVFTEPDASVEVRFLEQPYANSLIKTGKADEKGIFTFIADLPGRYQVSARKTGFVDNVITLIAADDCVPRITFVRKWLECSTSSCNVNIPVMTTQMKDVVVDLSDIYSIMSGPLNIRDKYGNLVNYYSLVGKELRFPLITDNFVISSRSNVNMRQINNLNNNIVELLLQTQENARVSGFVLNINDIGNNYINNITYISDEEHQIFRYTIEKNKIVIDQQLYLSPNSKFILYVSPVPLRCTYSYECPSDSICKDGTCVLIDCECGYIINRTCIPYECCRDEDCEPGKSCISHFCIYTPPSITEEEKKYISDRLEVLLTLIKAARDHGEDVSTANQLLEQARKAYEAGDFERAKELLTQAQQIFSESIEVKPSISYLAIVVITVLLVSLIVSYIIISRLVKPRWKSKKR